MLEQEFVITIPNFTPGIYSDDHVTHGGNSTPDGSVFNNGAATVVNTYRCHADMTGALVPLPARQNRMNETIRPLGGGHTANYPPGFEESYQEDIKVAALPPRIGGGAGDSTTDNVLVFVIHGWIYDPTAAGVNFALYGMVRTYQEYLVTSSFTPSTFDVHYYRSNTFGPPAIVKLPWGNFAHSISHLAGVAPNQLGLGVISAAMGWVLCDPLGNWGGPRHGTALNASDLTYTTYDTDVAATFISDSQFGVLAALHESGTAGVTFPLSRVAVNIPTALPNPNILGPLSVFTTLLVGHQGRFVGCIPDDGAGGWGYSGDQFWFSFYPTYLLHTGTAANPDYAGQIVAVPENSNGFGVVASLNAQDLLLINHYGGGAVVSGSMNSPTVNVLPNLHSTYGVSCQGVSTSLGFVYGGRYGVYIYNGGQTQSISQQLGGFFWDHIAGSGASVLASHRQNGTRGRFGWWDPYILVPNDWLYDTESQSWWKLELPGSREPYCAYDVSAASSPNGGKLYALPWRKTLASATTYDRYDHYVLAQNYSWQSQPLAETRDRMVTAHLVEFSATPTALSTTSQVSVTLHGIDESGVEIFSQVITVPLVVTNLRPQRFSIPIADFSAYYLQVTFAAASTGAGSAAPKIMSGVNIVCRDAAKLLRNKV